LALTFHHFIENCNTQTLLLKMNDDNAAQLLLLIDAICKNDIALASSLISSGSMNLNDEPLPLHRAAQHGVEIMTMLLDAGADINAVHERRRTACHIAILYDQFDALKLLVERGANLGVVDFRGHSLLSIVAQYMRDERFVILLLDAGAPNDGLSRRNLMTLVKSVAVFNRLVARGVNFTAMQDESGATLCHHVARNVTREDDLRALVNVCGNDAVHAVDNTGWTPLHWASSRGNELAMRVMVEFATRKNVALPTADEIDAARHRIAKTRLDLVRQRAFQICLGLAITRLNALQLCEILMHSFGALGSLIAFHQWWAIATKVKHFRDHKQAI
jgi:ankyrin repeat protein